MSDEELDIQTDANKPRAGFLVAAAVVSVTATMAYLYEDSIITATRGGAMAFAVIIVFLVLLALFLVLCYRNPRIGNRLLGYDVVIVKQGRQAKSDMQYSAGFKADTGVETKRMNSKRKQARHSRRKFAQVTREMHSEQKNNSENTNS